MSAKPSLAPSQLSDRQLTALFELAGIEIPSAIQDRVWAEARDLKSCAARLRGIEPRDLAAMLGRG